MKRWLWSMCVRLTGKRLLPECPMWCLGHPEPEPIDPSQDHPDRSQA